MGSLNGNPSKKASQVHESIELTVGERVEDGESMAMPNEFYMYKKQCHV